MRLYKLGYLIAVNLIYLKMTGGIYKLLFSSPLHSILLIKIIAPEYFVKFDYILLFQSHPLDIISQYLVGAY